MAAPGGLAASVRSRADIPAGPLLVALSGGADSAVLAWVAAQASDTVRAVFVDHGLKHSGTLRSAATSIARALDLTLDVVEAPVVPEAPSFEDAARAARYAALEGAAKPDETILTGHTADDQAETVLGNFLRGAGASGLAGIPTRRGRFVRPLLDVTRTETRALANQLELPFADDPDNESADPRRNRLRAALIPQLEREYNPNLRRVLRRSAGVMAADDAVLEARAGRVPVRFDGEVVSLPAPALAVVPEAVASRAVRRALRTMRGPHAGTHEEITAVLEVAAGLRTAAEITGGVRVEREGPMVVLSGPSRPPVEGLSLVVPASVVFDRWSLTFSVSDRVAGPRPLGADILTLDADLVGADLLVRTAEGEDRIDIGTGSKPVTEAMAESGVPRRLRARWPLILSAGRVAAIPRVRAAAWAWPSPTSARYLVARMGISGTELPAGGT